MCPSVRQILSVRPTDVRPSNRFAMGFATGFAMGLAWVFYTSHPRRARERPPKGAISRVFSKEEKNLFGLTIMYGTRPKCLMQVLLKRSSIFKTENFHFFSAPVSSSQDRNSPWPRRISKLRDLTEQC